MLVKRITYTDYDGRERTENFYFNLNKAELAKMEWSVDGGLTNMLQTISDSQSAPAIMDVFEDFVSKAYGVKSPDGKRFIKSKEITDEFMQTEAYSNLFIELFSDSKAMAEFFVGVIPANMQAEVAKKLAENGIGAEDVTDAITANTAGQIAASAN